MTDQIPPFKLLPDSEWKFVRDSVPIACVDVLPLRRDLSRNDRELGLIYRETPHQGRRWCLVGGRMFRNESLAEAAARQLRDTLGPQVRFNVPADAQPLYTAQ